MRPTTGLGQCGRYINRLELVALTSLLAQRHRVRDHDAAEFALVERFDGVATENAVRDDGDHFLRAIGHECIRRLHQRATCVGHVVDEDGDTILHIADENHARHFIRTRALFMDESEAEVEAVGDGGGSTFRSTLSGCRRVAQGAIEVSRVRWICYLLAPPASGLTITALLTSKFSLIHLSVLGSAYRLSTGTLKKP